MLPSLAKRKMTTGILLQMAAFGYEQVRKETEEWTATRTLGAVFRETTWARVTH
jgi:hypothetical protein